jgi:hypothetical protein
MVFCKQAIRQCLQRTARLLGVEKKEKKKKADWLVGGEKSTTNR